MLPLHGIGVIVTRPEQQSFSLCRMLEAQGAATLPLPALQIKPYGDAAVSRALVGAIDTFDLIVFTSANAVRFGSTLLEQRRDLTLVAIGPATARALSQLGYRVDVEPVSRFDSEALLAHPRLEKLAGKRILLIKGRQGREMLEREFGRRGARVVCVEVYERTPAQPAAAELAAVRARVEADRLHVITATSLDIGSHLLRMAVDVDLQSLLWLVPGTRIATGLRDLGLRAPLLTAASAEDQDLVAALLRWRAGESDA